MANSYFQFKQFTVQQHRCAMKVTTDGCLFGAWLADNITTSTVQLLDIGTGTGLLPLMIAQKNNTAIIDTIEIDTNAFEQATENINSSPWYKNITPLNDDVKKFHFTTRYNIIISNPPFYENEWASANSEKNTAHHSSHLLLKDLLLIIRQNLVADGKFYLLLPYKRHHEIMQLLQQNKIHVAKKILVRQSVNHDYFRCMIEAGFTKTGETVTTEIAIRNHQNEYTEAFSNLLKDYYLHIS